MKVVFMGSPAFAVPALEQLYKNGYEIQAVYTQPDKKTGRGQQIAACPVKQYAQSRGMRVIQPVTFKDPQELETLSNLSPDIIAVAAYGKILPDSVLAVPRYNCINIHPSLLPKYRGPSPISAAILNGDRETGVTIMLINSKVDSGPILAQRELTIQDDDTTETLTHRLSSLGADLLIETLPSWIEGNIRAQEQNDRAASYTRMETKEDGMLDWNQPAVNLWRKVRAYYPWPGCYTTWKNMRLKIIKAVPLQYARESVTGQVFKLEGNQPAAVAVKTGEGWLGLVSILPEGKREMSPVEFAAGHKDFIGSVL